MELIAGRSEGVYSSFVRLQAEAAPEWEGTPSLLKQELHAPKGPVPRTEFRLQAEAAPEWEGTPSLLKQELHAPKGPVPRAEFCQNEKCWALARPI